VERRADEVWERIEQPRLQEWYSGQEIDMGPEGTRLRRYEAAADRLFRSAWNKLEGLRKERGEPMTSPSERGFDREQFVRPDPPAVPRPAPVTPAPVPAPAPAPVSTSVRPGVALSESSLLGDPAPPVLDFWAGGPPLTGLSPGFLSRYKTNPTPDRPAKGRRADRRGNRG